MSAYIRPRLVRHSPETALAKGVVSFFRSDKIGPCIVKFSGGTALFMGAASFVASWNPLNLPDYNNNLTVEEAMEVAEKISAASLNGCAAGFVLGGVLSLGWVLTTNERLQVEDRRGMGRLREMGRLEEASLAFKHIAPWTMILGGLISGGLYPDKVMAVFQLAGQDNTKPAQIEKLSQAELPVPPVALTNNDGRLSAVIRSSAPKAP